MSLAVEDNSVVAYSCFTWAVYLAVETHVTHYDANEVMIVDEVLEPGLHFFSYKINPDEHRSVNLVWQLGAEILEYNLRIASTASQAFDWQTATDNITISERWLNEEIKEIAIGCIACALIPAIPIIPLVRRKADHDVYALF